MMCLPDLYAFTPEQRAAIVRLEELRRMKEVTQMWRDHYQSMPTAPAEVSPCMDAWAVGFYQEKAA